MVNKKKVSKKAKPKGNFASNIFSTSVNKFAGRRTFGGDFEGRSK